MDTFLFFFLNSTNQRRWAPKKKKKSTESWELQEKPKKKGVGGGGGCWNGLGLGCKLTNPIKTNAIYVNNSFKFVSLQFFLLDLTNWVQLKTWPKLEIS